MGNQFMTNKEFNKYLEDKIAQHPLMRRKPNTLNELIWVLRQEPVDYNLSWSNPDGSWTCVPSAKECFIPVRDLAKHVLKIEYDPDDFEGVIYHNLQLELD